MSLHDYFKQHGHGGQDQQQHAGPGQPGAPSGEQISHEIALKDKKEIAENTWAFTFEKPAGFQFKAGQHVRMSLINPPATDSEGNTRFLSMACTPTEPDLTFVFRMSDSAFKQVMKDLQPGDKVLIEMLAHGSPRGAFALEENNEDASRLAVFLIGGIGIVPIYSMIKDALERGLPHQLFLFYATRHPASATFLAELQTLADQHENFTFIPTMTEPEQSEWTGATGLISADTLRQYLPDLQTPIYYIAGMPDMVQALQQVLADAGVNPDSIRSEEFGSFTTAHPPQP